MPTRTSESLGNWASASVPVSIESSGLASTSSTAETAITAVHGRAITRAVHFSQNSLRPVAATAVCSAVRRR